MTDLTVKRDGELMVAHFEGNTEGGIDFLDSYNPVGVEFQVVDSGRIIVPEAAADAVREAACERGLTVDGVSHG